MRLKSERNFVTIGFLVFQILAKMWPKTMIFDGFLKERIPSISDGFF